MKSFDTPSSSENADIKHEGHENCENIGLDTSGDGKKKGRHRPRKRKLYGDICKQVEFYFSDANISKNRTMLDLISASEYVDLEQLLNFNKLVKLVPHLSVEFLQKAVAQSEALELSPDSKGVRRKIPYDPNKLKTAEEMEKCTIYVENVPSNIDHEWLEKIFQEFGPIAYIAVPKFKHNGAPKGFAFVEFKEPEGSERCLKAYGDIGACLPNNINPEQLLSVRTYEQPESASPRGKPKGTEKSESDLKHETPNLRKRHAEGSEDEVSVKKERLAEDEEGSGTLENNSFTEDQDEENGNNNSNHEKKKRRKVCKTKKTEDIEKRESDSIQLKILPKKIWRQLRNRYLNLQRENLGKLKRQLRYQGNGDIRGERQGDPRKTNRDHASPSSEQPLENKPKNVLVRIEFKDAPESEEALKAKLLSSCVPAEHSGILKFVDYSLPDKFAVIRLDGNSKFFEGVGEFLRTSSKIFKSVLVLNDQQVKEYWTSTRAKIKPDSKKKVRGRDKLLQQAMKTASHIRFVDEEGDENKQNSETMEEVAEPDSSSVAN